MQKLVFISILLLTLASCSKEKITQSNYPDFIGEWNSVDEDGGWTELSLQEDLGIWHYQRSGMMRDVRGKAKIDPDEGVIHIRHKKFYIDQYPTETPENWIMILDDQEFIRLK